MRAFLPPPVGTKYSCPGNQTMLKTIFEAFLQLKLECLFNHKTKLLNSYLKDKKLEQEHSQYKRNYLALEDDTSDTEATWLLAFKT